MFQRWSCGLDVGVRIYELRVDSTHQSAFQSLAGIHGNKGMAIPGGWTAPVIEWGGATPCTWYLAEQDSITAWPSVKSMCTDPTQLPQHMCRTCVCKALGGCMHVRAGMVFVLFLHVLSPTCFPPWCLGDGDEELGEGGTQSSQGGPGAAAARRMAQGVKVRVKDTACAVTCPPVTCRTGPHSTNAAHHV